MCRDGFRNYYYRPLKCPHTVQKELHPELSSEDDEESVEEWGEMYSGKRFLLNDRPIGFSSVCNCDYPRWCKLISNRNWVEDDYFEITAEEESCCHCCCCCGAKSRQVPVR